MKNTTMTDEIIKLKDAPKILEIGKKVFMSNPMGGEDLMTITDKGENWIIVKGDKLSLRMETDKKLIPQKIKINIGGNVREITVEEPYFRKAPEYNQ